MKNGKLFIVLLVSNLCNMFFFSVHVTKVKRAIVKFFIISLMLEQLLSSENPQSLVDQTLDKQFESINEEKFSTFLNEIGSSKLNYEVLVSILSGSIKRIGNLIKDPNVQLSCLECIKKFLETRNVKDVEDQLLEQISKTYEEMKRYADAAKTYLERQNPDKDDEEKYLDFFEHVGELWLKSGDKERLQITVNRLNGCIFRQRTPRPYQDRYDFLHGYSAVYSSNFDSAIRAFSMIVNNSKNAANVSLALRLASICACLNINSISNSLLKSYAQDEKVQQFEFYDLIDLMSREQFIDQAARDEFISKTKKYFDGTDLSDDLIKSSLQHNLKVAEKFYSSVKIERLANLIGSTPIDVEKQMKFMIGKKQINALIDQPAKMVIFTKERSQSQDESILEYSNHVNAIVERLP